MSSQWKQGVAAILAVWMLLLLGRNGNAQERAPVPEAAAEHAAKKMAGEIYGGRFALPELRESGARDAGDDGYRCIRPPQRLESPMVDAVSCRYATVGASN